jgi:hypothetical protein
MTEIEKLNALRDKFIARRRSLAESLQKTPAEQLTGESLTQIQSAIEAVNRAIQDEMQAKSTHEAQRRAMQIS